MRITLSRLAAGLMLACAAVPAMAQQGKDDAPALKATLAKDGSGRLMLTAVDTAKLASQDRLSDGKFGVPLRYAVSQDVVGVDLQKSGAGRWRTLPDGRLTWRIDVAAQDAKTLDFAFSKFRLPHGAELVIRAADGKDMLGPYTSADNPADGGFHTPLLAASGAVIELTLPADKRDHASVELDSVNHGYRDPFEAVKYAKSGSCNIDVACQEGDGWQNQIDSVAHYTFQTGGQGYVCTGQLMATGNRGADVSAPRFSTAYHCVSTPAEVQSMVFYWGYESPTCRAPGGTASGTPLSTSISRATQSGASLLAAHRPTDWTAVQLNAPVPSAANPYYSGWDRSGVAPPATIGIHHPSGHEKRITLNTDTPTTTASCINPPQPQANSHWFISEYERGTTEGGSSGSGLWSSTNGLLIGVLSGGWASCSEPEESDCYGRLSAAWETGTTPQTRMRDHFDRSGANPQTMQGLGSCNAPTVTLSSAAFASNPAPGSPVQINASASGGAGGGYVYAFDLDGDGVSDQTGSSSSVSTVYNTRQSVQVAVTVTDSAGCAAIVSDAIDITGPALDIASAGAPTQVCGNNDGKIDPGERWQQAVTVRNVGDSALAAGSRALFAPGGICSYGFVDIANGVNAVPALTLSAASTVSANDDGRNAQPIALGGNGLSFNGSVYPSAVMSTNGYVSFNTAESGGDYDAGCNTEPNRGSVGPQLRPLHDDLVVGSTAGAGLRYRYFASCPRVGAGAGCHVFQWSRMAQYVNSSTAQGDFEFQALVYDGGSVVYQYNTASPDSGSGATIGFVTAQGAPSDAFCGVSNPAPARSAICFGDTPDSVRVETPTQQLGSLSPNTQTTLNVTFAVPAGAACGSNLGVNFIAAAADNLSSLAPERVLNANVGTGCAAVSTCAANVPEIDTRQGYFNSKRQGNGLASYSYGGGWYTAERDRTPTWYQLSGSYVDNLMRLPIGQTFNAAAPNGLNVGVVELGSAWLARIDENTQMYAWQFDDGRSGAEVMTATLAGTPRPGVNHTETWFSLAQPGWGLAVDHAVLGGSTLEAFGVFFYDNAGDPRWALGVGTGANGAPVTLTAERPHCPGCPQITNWQAGSTNVGTITPNWNGSSSGTFNTTITLPAPYAGTWNRTGVQMIPILAPEQP